MKKKGIIALEAMLVFLAVIAITSIFLQIFSEQNKKLEEVGDTLKAKGKAEECALLVNSIYSNSGNYLKKFESNCFASENTIKAKSGKKEAEGKVIAKKVKTTQKGKSTKIEVEVEQHYG